MRRCAEPLPKHVFYEDNLMVCRTLQFVKKMYYMNIDLYRYWIGRPDQSMQEKTMLKRFSHHKLVAEKCFSAFHFDDIKEPMQKKYLKHEMFMIFSFAIIYTRKNKTKASIAGFVTNVTEGASKGGRPMSRMTVEDYSGSYEIALFGKDHENFMSYMQMHSAIFIEGEIEEKYYIKPEERRRARLPLMHSRSRR